jgi:hypothetical protein
LVPRHTSLKKQVPAEEVGSFRRDLLNLLDFATATIRAVVVIVAAAKADTARTVCIIPSTDQALTD